MAFNTAASTSTADLVNTAIVNQINVDGTNVKVLPAGTNPTVVYRVGDGTVHPEGWNNVIGETYLDFYVSTGAQGAKGDKGEDGVSAYTQAVANGYTGTEAEFYALLTNVAANAVLAGDSATAAAASETAAALSATNAATSETNAAASASTASTAATNAATSESNAATSAANASTSATSAAGSATSASNSASSASTSATNAQNAADLAVASYDLFDDRFLGSKASDPTLDNDGDTLQAGTLYYNATAGEIRVYSGSAWEAITVATTLNGLTDVTIAGLADGHILQYNSTSGQWENVVGSFVLATTPTLEAGTVVTEGVQLNIGITNYEATATYTVIGTGCTATHNAGTVEITNPTTATPSFTVQASFAGWEGEDSAIVTRNLTTTLATPTLDAPADSNIDTDVTYTITVSDNSDKLVFDPQSADFTYISATGGTGAKVGNTIEVTGITGTSVTVTLQYTVAATYSNRAQSIDTGASYTTSAWSTADSIVIGVGSVADDALVDTMTTDVINDGF